jgi:hypothetical protein
MNTSKTNSVGELVRRNENDYNSGNVTISEYVDFSLKDTVNRIDAYLNSKHISGATDSMGRDKPFFNIVTAATNIWYRATDIDRKNIKIKATKSSDMLESFLATIHLQEWMRKNNFGVFLNDWGRTLSRYGSAVSKFIETDGELHAMVIPWNRLIVDPMSFDNDAVIEVLELTPSQLRKRNYNQDVVEQLIETASYRETLGGENKDTKQGFIRLYEVHGELPLSNITDKEEDEFTYVQQMHVLSFVMDKDTKEYQDFTLYKGKEKKSPYMISDLIGEDGRTLSIGAVENLFESQWMLNHNAKQIKDQLDLASKLIFQTSDGNFVGQNALTSIETGDIMIHSPNQPITQVANNSHDIASLQSYGNQWKSLSSEINGISESMMGNAAPSGTAWRQVEALLSESHSLFEIMTENKGLELENMLTTYILPHLKTKMDTSKEITATLEGYMIDKIDRKYIKSQATKNIANKAIKQIIDTGEIPTLTDEDVAGEEAKVKASLSAQGTQRFFKPSEIENKTWKELFKNLEWDLEIDITGEQKDNQSDMATLATVFQTVVGLQGQPMTPRASFLFNKILEKTNTVSPLELAEMSEQADSLPVTPIGGEVGAGVQQLAN